MGAVRQEKATKETHPMRTTTGTLVKRNGVFYALWHFEGKRFRESTKCTSKRDAEKVLAEKVAPYLAQNKVAVLQAVTGRLQGAETEAAQLLDAANPPLRMCEAWTAFKDSQNRPDSGPRTLADYERQWGTFETWFAKRHPKGFMRDVSETDAADYAAKLAKEVGPSTFNKHVALLTLVFRVLAKQARTTVNPFAEVKRKRAVAKSRRELTIDELRRVADAADGEHRLLLAIGIYTGLRLGDAATLRWDEVDLGQGEIRRVPNKTARRQNHLPVVIPVHPSLASMLAEVAPGGRKGVVLPETAEVYRRDPSAITKRLQALFTSCGIETHGTVNPAGKASVSVGFHSLRHSFVSMCRAANVPLSVVESIVGHSSPAMTRHYTHTGADAARAAIGTLPGLDADKPPALPAMAVQSVPLPETTPAVKAAAKRILAALDAGDTATARREAAALAGE